MPRTPCAVGVAGRCEPAWGASATPRLSPALLSTRPFLRVQAVNALLRLDEEGLFSIETDLAQSLFWEGSRLGMIGGTGTPLLMIIFSGDAVTIVTTDIPSSGFRKEKT